MKYLEQIRIISIIITFVGIVYWGVGGYSSVGTAGLINDIMTGIVLFMVLVINITSYIFYKSEKSYKELANRMTLFSLASLLIFLLLPLVAERLTEL